jgi:hypothetical protein
MPSVSDTVSAAENLFSKDEAALLLEIGLRDNAIAADPARADDPNLVVVYDGTHMGMIDDLKALGGRIASRWNKELYGIVCPNASATETSDDRKMRDDVLKALNLSDAAVIAAVATGLIALGAPAAIAAPVAPFLVKKFIMPAKDELCDAWGEALD